MKQGGHQWGTIVTLLTAYIAAAVALWLPGRGDLESFFNSSRRYLRHHNDHVIALSRTASTVILSDTIGSFSFSINAPTDERMWRIETPMPLSKVHFYFERLNIASAELQVYDLSDYNLGQKAVFSCIACGTNIPPMFSTRTGSVVVIVKGVVGVSFSRSDFTLSYIGQLESLSSGQSTNPYGDVQLRFSMAYGKVFPVLIAGVLPANSTFTWTLQMAGPMITLSMDNYQIDTSSCFSNLAVYDGLVGTSRLLYNGSACGPFPQRWLFTTSPTATIVLRSFAVVSTCSFEISYYSDANLYRCGSLFQPDVMTAQSMLISDGSPSSQQMRRGVACYWRIAAEEANPLYGDYSRYFSGDPSPNIGQTGRITLLFPWVSIKNGARIRVFDSADDKGIVLWDSIGFNTLIPPPLISTGRDLYISFESNSYLSDGYRGFRGEYLTRQLGSAGIGSRVEILSMSSALDITAPGQFCLSDTETCSFTGGLNYSWLVQPMGSSGSIVFVFSYLRLLKADDILIIYDGIDEMAPVIAMWRGRSGATFQSMLPRKWIVTSGTAALVVLRSGSSSSLTNTSDFRGGMNFSFYSDGPNYRCGFSTNPATMTSPTHIFTDGTSAATNVLSNQWCEWRINPYSLQGGVTLLFDRLDIPKGTALNVYEEYLDRRGRVLARSLAVSLTETSAVPSPIVVTSSMFLTYETGVDTKGSGFKLNYFSAQGLNTIPGSGTIEVLSSSVLGISLPPMVGKGLTLFEPGWTGLWNLRPKSGSGAIILSVMSLTFPDDCSDNVTIYEFYLGSKVDLWSSCGSRAEATSSIAEHSRNISVSRSIPSNWIMSNTSSVFLEFKSSENSTGLSNFNISYVYDGPNFHCGFLTNPAIMTAPSYLFSDGSASSGALFPNQDCEWLIIPTNGSAPTQNTPLVVMLSILSINLNGAHLQVFDGRNGSSVLLWDCLHCNDIPSQMVSTTGSFYIKYTSFSSAPGNGTFGEGFTAQYWSIAMDNSTWSNSVRPNQVCRGIWSDGSTACYASTPTILDQPLNAHGSDSQGSWLLSFPDREFLRKFKNRDVFSNPKSVLSFWPASGFASSTAIDKDIFQNGRVMDYGTIEDHAFFAKRLDNQLAGRTHCGTWHSELSKVDTPSGRASGFDTSIYSLSQGEARNPLLVDEKSGFRFRSTQSGGGNGIYVSPPNFWLSGQLKEISKHDTLFNSVENKISVYPFSLEDGLLKNDLPVSAGQCRYVIDTTVSQDDYSESYFETSTYGFTVTLTVTKTSCGANSPRKLRIYGGVFGNETIIYDSSAVERDAASGIATVTAPCGKVLIVFDDNEYGNGKGEFESCGFDIQYFVDYADTAGIACQRYIDSLIYVPKEGFDFLLYVLPVGVGLIALCCGGICFLLGPMAMLSIRDFFKIGPKGPRKKYVKTSSLHPRYSPKIDAWKNKFLRKGACCICKCDPMPVFDLKCGHSICNDDLTGLLDTALGNIAMFPVKCPMHYEGCTGTIGSIFAKRVLTEPKYQRFIDFHDRSIFGEGTRCIYCDNFVNYPMSSKVSMVTCPYCVQIFCLKCRQPWHSDTGKCPLERAEDESLEVWKEHSGAQRCPACRKLIEKDDPDTCNHMVHRITDGIPCVRDRTDFCYLCGTEVLGDYPHNEVGNLGVNHFPDGVFQRCRTIVAREKAAERERIRKSKRRKSSKRLSSYSTTFVVPGEWDADTAPSTPAGEVDIEQVDIPGPPPDAFDDGEEDEWDKELRIHPASPIRTTRRQLPSLRS